ncbi:MAG: hypothetical protein ACOCP4_05620 [Candidatus Woesearchaeota archaeon]
MKFQIKYGLGGSFGGTEFVEPEVLEFETEREAENYAFEKAVEEYEMYEGTNGILSTDDIMEEYKVDYEEAMEIYLDERESWLDYSVKKL